MASLKKFYFSLKLHSTIRINNKIGDAIFNEKFAFEV